MKKSLIFFLLFSAILHAQDSFIIKDVRLFDGEKVHEKTSVLIEDGLVSMVTPKIKKKYTVIDGNGKTLIPALSNAHVHAWSILSLKEAAKAGVLNIFDMHGVEMMQQMMKQYNDSTNYSNYYVAGAAATAPEGHGTQFGFPSPTLTTPEEAKEFVQTRINGGADYIKIIVEPWKKTLSHETVKALINETHAHHKIAVVHISKVNDAYKVLQNKANGLVHIWWDKKLSKEQLATLTKNNSFFVIPTLLTSVKVLKMIRKNSPEGAVLTDEELKAEVKKLYDAGVPILAGTDPPNAQINYGTDLYKELELLVAAGLPEIEVLKSATSSIAKAFSLSKQGYIKKGYTANMVLIDGNPLEDIKAISQIHTIWKTGKKVAR